MLNVPLITPYLIRRADFPRFWLRSAHSRLTHSWLTAVRVSVGRPWCTVYSDVRPKSPTICAAFEHPQVLRAPLPHRGPRAHRSRGVCAGWHDYQVGRAAAAHRRAQAQRRGRRATPAKAARQLRLKRRGLPWPRLGFPAGWSRAEGAPLLTSECSGATGCSQSSGASRGATPLTYTALLLSVMKGENSPLPTFMLQATTGTARGPSCVHCGASRPCRVST